jgi:hypothetical protein
MKKNTFQWRSHLVACCANWRKLFVPQLKVSRNFSLDKRQKLRGRRRYIFGRARGDVEPELLSRTCKFKFFDGDAGLVDDFQGLRVCCIGKKGCAKRVEYSSGGWSAAVTALGSPNLHAV